MPSFRLGRGKAALANVPADVESFPVSIWFQGLLEKGVQRFILNGLAIRQPSPPGVGTQFIPDGSNLPWVVERLRKSPKAFRAWVDHVGARYSSDQPSDSGRSGPGRRRPTTRRSSFGCAT